MDSIPYLMVSQDIEMPVALDITREVKVYVCINLVNHNAVGIALDRDAALDAMSEALDRIEHDRFYFDDFDWGEN